MKRTGIPTPNLVNSHDRNQIDDQIDDLDSTWTKQFNEKEASF